MKNKYNIKNKKNNLIKKMLMFAAVNPDYLKKISDVLKRELVAEKDTEDYFREIISSYFDKASFMLREAGQSKIKSGDAFKISELLLSIDQKRDNINFVYENKMAAGIYRIFPFTYHLGEELRTHFILQTEKKDSFDSLMDEADGLITKFLSIDDWVTIKNAIKKSEPRLLKSKIRFLEPEVVKGFPEKITQKEFDKYHLDKMIDEVDKNFIIDNRTDSHDILALKEFVQILKGKDVHSFSISLGFFAKYMPELLELNINSILFKVKDNKLSEIKINRIVDDENDLLGFSPIDSAFILLKNYGKYNNETKDIDFNQDEVFKDDTKFYILVNGAVAAPKNGIPLAYESLSVNDEKINCGEVFLYKKAEDQETEIESTRLYFVPYSYENFHLVHQHGSVIFGSNDQSFNSCVIDVEEFFDEEALTDIYKESLKDVKILFDPAFLAARKHKIPKEVGLSDEIFTEKYYETMFNAMGSLYEETPFTLKYLLTNYLQVSEKSEKILEILTKNYAPLTKRFILGKYFEDGNGLMLDKMETIYDGLSNKLYKKYKYQKLLKKFDVK